MEAGTPGGVGFLDFYPEGALVPGRSNATPIVKPEIGKGLRAARWSIGAINLKLLGWLGRQIAGKRILGLQGHGCCSPIRLRHLLLPRAPLGIPGGIIVGEFCGRVISQLHDGVRGKRDSQERRHQDEEKSCSDGQFHDEALPVRRACTVNCPHGYPRHASRDKILEVFSRRLKLHFQLPLLRLEPRRSVGRNLVKGGPLRFRQTRELTRQFLHGAPGVPYFCPHFLHRQLSLLLELLGHAVT